MTNRICQRMFFPATVAAVLVACSTAAPGASPAAHPATAAPLDFTAYHERFSWDLDGSPRAFAIDPNGRFAIVSLVGHDRTALSQITLLDFGEGGASTLDLTLPFNLSSTAYALAIAPDGASLAAGWTGDIAVVRLEDRSVLQAMQHVYDGNARGSFNDLRYSPDGAHILGITHDLVWWDAVSGARVGILEDLAGPRRVGIAEGGVLGMVLQDAVEIRRLGAADPACRFEGTGASVAPSPDGAHVAGAFRGGAMHLWRVQDCHEVSQWSAGTEFVQSMGWAPDSQHLVTGSSDGVIRIWDTFDGTLVHELDAHAEGTTGVAVSADGRRLITASWADRTIKLWEAGTPR